MNYFGGEERVLSGREWDAGEKLASQPFEDGPAMAHSTTGWLPPPLSRIYQKARSPWLPPGGIVPTGNLGPHRGRQSNAQMGQVTLPRHGPAGGWDFHASVHGG